MRARVLTYGFALLLGGLALSPRVLLGGSAETTCQLLLLAAVVVSSRRSGLAAGLLTGLTGTLADLLLQGVASASSAEHAIAGTHLVFFSMIAVFVSWMLRRTRQQLDRQSILIDAMSADTHQGMLVLDGAGRITSANAAAQTMLRGTKEFLQLRPVADFLPLEMPDTATATGRTLPAGLVQGVDVITFRVDGTSFPASCSVTPLIGSDKQTGLLLAFRDITERKRAEAALRESEARYRKLVDTLPYGVILADADEKAPGTILMANPQAAACFGYGENDTLMGAPVLDLFAPEGHARLRANASVALESEAAGDAEYVGRRRDGSSFPAEITLSGVLGGDGEAHRLILVARDLTERKIVEAAQRLSETRKGTQHVVTAALAASMSIEEAVMSLLQTVGSSEEWAVGAFWRVNGDGTALQCRHMWHAFARTAAGFEELSYRLSLTPGMELPGKVWQLEKAVWIEDIMTDPSFSRALVATRAGLKTAVCVPVRFRGKIHSVIELFSRDRRPCDVDFVRMLSSVGAQLAQFLERKEAERALQYQASHDALTDLPNRTLLLRRLQHSLHAARSSEGTLALLLLDLDRFKEVNDTFGHLYGDQLLQEVARRLTSVVRDTDTVARLGGDEFAVLLPSTDEIGAKVVARTVLSALSQPVIVCESRVDVWASLGIAMFPDHGGDPDVLMQRADVAMYAAKRSKTGSAVYAPEQDEHSAGRLQIISDLRQAVEQGGLVLHYQPKVNFTTGAIESVEALVRWPHEQRGLIGPDQFIPLAEQTGLITPLTRWVLTAAMRQARLWQQEGIHLRVAVNLSSQGLHDPALVEIVQEILEAEQVDPSALEIEITEGAIMVDSARALETLRRLHDMGVRLAIDDFGTGYSSLSYLKQLPVHEIKIDKSFVLDMNANREDTFIAQSVIDLGHNLGLEVVAEGVQSQDSWNLLTEMRCDVGQGFHSGRPAPADEITAWLQDMKRSQFRDATLRDLRELRNRGA